MPNVTAPTRQMGNGDVVTQFVDSVGTSAVTYTYPKTQEKFIVRNMGPSSLSVTIAGVTQVVDRGEKWQKVADFTSFAINAVSGFTAFDAWADEKGSTFDSAEGQYFATGVVSGGGSGVLVYPTLSALQAALSGGSTTPVWVTADNSWYYWTGAVTVTIPATPSAPTAAAGNNKVDLSWTAVSGATSYKVYRGGTLLASPTTTTYSDATAVNGTSYSYTVSAVNTAGESPQSPATSATPVAPAIPATPAAPTATAGNAQVALTWGTVSGATGYKVYRGGTLIASPTVSNYTDTGLTNGTAYSYTISATNAAGESPQSAATSATPALPAIPAVPTGLAATAGNAQVALTWNAVTGADSYKVYRGGTLLASPTAANYTDTTAVNGTAYSYTVSSVNAGGESAQSSAASATPAAPSGTAITPSPYSLSIASGSTTFATANSLTSTCDGAAYTIAFNFRVASATAQNNLFCSNRHPIFMSNTGIVNGWYNSAGGIVASTTAIIADTWYHVAAVLSAGTYKLYINGVLESTKTGLAASFANTTVEIGSLPAQTTNRLNGRIKDIYVFSRALTAGEVTNLKQETSIDKAGLVANYMMYSNTDTVLKDSAGTNDGIFTGTSYSYVAD